MGVGFALILAVTLLVLLQTPRRVTATNYVPLTEELGLFHEHTTVCQANELLPSSTSALRISLIALRVGPAVSVTVSHAGRVVATGHHNAGWFSGSLTLPLTPTVTRPTRARICLTRGPVAGPLELAGSASPRALATTVNGTPLAGRMRIEYLAHGHRSWLSLARSVTRRIGIGRAPSGTWIVLPLALMMAIAVSLGAWLLLREERYE